jgi:hypothetical protein
MRGSILANGQVVRDIEMDAIATAGRPFRAINKAGRSWGNGFTPAALPKAEVHAIGLLTLMNA